MSLSLDERRIAQIVERVVADLRPIGSQLDGSGASPSKAYQAADQRTGPATATGAGGEHVVFPDSDAAIEAHLGTRPVYVVRLGRDLAALQRDYRLVPVADVPMEMYEVVAEGTD